MTQFGLLRVVAMARPRRPETEAALVRELTAHMGGTVRARATRAARMVASEAVAYLDTDPDDVTDRLILIAQAQGGGSPAYTLATCPEIDIASIVIAARTRRFQARGGRQLSERAWSKETIDVLNETAALLAERFRRHLRK